MNLPKINFITHNIENLSPAYQAEEVCKGGIKFIQLRIKDINEKDYIKAAQDVRDVCKKYGALLIINDNVVVAQKVRADGVHLGRTDMAPADARKILGSKYIIGGTANNFERIQQICNVVDYIGLGHYRFTTTKINLTPNLGFDGVKNVMDLCKQNNISVPVYAIGGIVLSDIKPLTDIGIYGICVSSAILQAPDISVEAIKFAISL